MMREATEEKLASRDWLVTSGGVGAGLRRVTQHSEHGLQLPGGSPFAEKGAMEQPVDICSEAHLRQATGEEDLAGVRNLALTVDTNVTQVDHLGTLMPLLTELRLERGSTLASFRDLGNSLSHLRVLWLSACGVVHLDGVAALSGLEELYLAFNDVEDLTSIALHDRLEVLDLESNNVGASEQAIQLGTCSRLWSLNLIANPVCRERRYRTNVIEAVPQLASLDERDVTDDDRRPLSAGSDESDGQHRADFLPTFSAEACTPSPYHLEIHSDWEMFSRTKAKQNIRASCLVESAECLRPQELPASLPEVQSRRARSSAFDEWHGGNTAALPDMDVAGSGGEQATLSQIDGSLSGRSVGRGQIDSDLRSSCCASVSTMKATTEEELHNSSSRSPTYLLTGGGHVEAGGMEEVEEEEESVASLASNEGDGRRSLARHSECVSGVRDRGEPSRPDRTSRSFTAHLVDEEEMIGKAIKNFRLLSERSTSRSSVSSNEHTHGRRNPRCANAQTGSPSGSRARWVVNGKRRAPPATADISPARSSTSGADMDGRGGWSPRESGDAMGDCTAQAGVDSDIKMEGQGVEGKKDEISLGTSDLWAGKDWLLQILSLSDMRLAGTSSVSQPPLEAAENAASMLTHGSQVSFAGNPALGLRHRRRPDETSNAVSYSLSMTQAQLRTVGRRAGVTAVARQEKNWDDWRRSEVLKRRASIRARGNGASNAGRLLKDDEAIESAAGPEDRSVEGDAKMDHEQDEVEAREDETPRTSAGGTCALEPGCACMVPCSCASSCSAASTVCGRHTAISRCPEEVWLLSARASWSSQPFKRTQQLSRVHHKFNIGAQGTKASEIGKTEAKVTGAPSGSPRQADAVSCLVDSPPVVDRQKRSSGPDLIDVERRKLLHRTSATEWRTSSSRQGDIDVKDDTATCKARRRRRRLSKEPLELFSVPTRGDLHAFSGTRVVLKPVEVPEWLPTTATDICRDYNNGSGGGYVDGDDDNGLIFIVGEGGKTKDPAVSNACREGSAG